MENTSEAALLAWRGAPFLTIALLLASLTYWRGWRALNYQVPERFPVWRFNCFLCGLLSFYVAVASPLDTFAGFLLQVHMVQHLLLTMVVPPLILLGAPWLPVLRGLPRAWVRDAIGPFLHGRCWKTLAGFFSHPIAAWVLFVLSNVLWHLPLFYDTALRSEFWHAFEHLCFLGTSLLFWWHVVLPWPARPHWSRWMAIPYLLLADLQNTALAGFLSFYDKPLYESYQNIPRLWGQTVIGDQAAAGVIMWVPGSLAFLIPAGAIAVGLLSPQCAVRPSARPATNGRAASKVRRSWLINLARTPARRIIQLGLLLLAVIVIADGFLGPRVSSMNLAGVLPWTYWRGFAVIALLAVGNFFCSVCPFVLARDLVRKAVPGSPRRIWPRALRNKWTSVSLLIVFLWAYEVFDVWDRPTLTALFILGYFAAAIAIDWVFRGASFCKYVCPIGQYQFAFSANSPAEIRVSNSAVCNTCSSHDCLRGNERDRGCETHLFQPAKSGNFDCTFCLDCVRACPHDNVDLHGVVPARDLGSDQFRSAIGRYSRRPDLAALSGIFTAGAFVNAGGMSAPIATWIGRISEALSISQGIVTSGLFIFSLLIVPLAGGAATAWVASRMTGGKVGASRLLTRFAFASIPLGASLWAAHFLFHLLTGSFTIVPVAARVLHDLGMDFSPDWTLVGFSGDWITALELTLLDIGFLGSIYIAWKMNRDLFSGADRLRGFLPWCVFLSWLFLAAVWIIFQPMDMRGTLIMSH
jgi:cytochrome c oxidase assembly factor CtaG/ferredoxin